MRHPMKRRSVKRLFRFPTRTEADVRQEVHDEFAFHLDMRAEVLIASGVPADAAREQALREFGDASQAARVAVSRQKHIERRGRVARAVDELRQDITLGWRSLRRSPGFTLTAVIVIALGIGATTALFSVLSAVLLRPLPYPDADRLVEIWTTTGGGDAIREPVALPDFRAMRDRSRSFDALGAFSGSGVIITADERAEFVQAISMTASTWHVLGVAPLIGRTFADAEEAWGSHRVAVISEPLWWRRFGGDPGAVGRQLRFGPQSLTVVGVMPASFRMAGYDADIWMPMSFPPGSPMETRNNRFASVLGRLRPGITVQQARNDLSAIAEQLRRDYPNFNAGLGVATGEWREGLVGSVRPTLVLLFGAVVLVLLIACANLANLLIARAVVRERELQTRAMLGADRARLIRGMLTEIVLLVAAGGIAGVAIAAALIRALTWIGPIGLPRLNEVTMDAAVMTFSIALMLLTTLLFGLWPSRYAARASVTTTISSAARTIAGGRIRQRSRRALIVAEVSLSLVLLIGATLLIVSLRRLQHVEAGFNTDRLLTTMVIRYRPDGREAFVQQLVDRISNLPGVRAAAATNSLPLAPGGWGRYFTADDTPVPGSIAEVPTVSYYHVTPRYFETLETPIRRGRSFTARDRGDQPLVAVVNETLARRVWPDEDPIGKRIAMFAPEPLAPQLLPLPDGSTTFPRVTVVGVVADIRQAGLDQTPNPSVFVPLAQGVRAGAGDSIQGFHYLVVRTTDAPLSIASAVEAATRESDRNAALNETRTMEARLDDSTARRRFAMLLLAAFAALALTLASVGLYGVMSYTVSQRRAELGVRAAVGASAASLLRLVMTDGLRMALVGAGIGLVLAAILSNFMATLLFEVRGVIVRLYAGVTIVLLTVAAAACWIPAIRAARTDPATTLRGD